MPLGRVLRLEGIRRPPAVLGLAMDQPTIRPALKSEGDFIFKTWKGVAWDQQRWLCRHKDAPRIARGGFMQGMERRIRRALGRSSALVAQPVECRQAIAGFIVYAGPTVHMVYVKGNWRKKGIAGLLLCAAGLGGGFQYSQHTGAMVHLARKWRAEYNPFEVEV